MADIILPTVRQLQYLSALRKYGSFSLAANKCGVAQSTISLAIIELEKVFGDKLIYRDARNVDFLGRGRRVEAKGRKALKIIEIMVEEETCQL